MDVNIGFKKLSLVNGDEAVLSISHSSMKKVVMDLVANGYLTTEELIILAIGQIKLCDPAHLDLVLPENVLEKLNESFKSVRNGEFNV